MKTASPYSGALHRILLQPTNGVAGLVDELLTLCQHHGLQVDWQADRCRVRANEGDWEELREVPLRKSVFRAVIARVAALCNEQTPNAVSPYGGQGELTVGVNPPALIRVIFVNTPKEQKLELLPKTEPAAATSQQKLHNTPRVASPFEAEQALKE